MNQHQYSPLRSRSARKPWPTGTDMVLFRCEHCEAVFYTLGDVPAQPPQCCDAPMQHLVPQGHAQLEHEVLDYKIVGGFNQNAVQLFWNTPENKPRWAALKTFTGCYFKHVPPQKVAPLVFPLADEDAYVYCDRDICQQCLFRCKKGFVLYAWIDPLGLVELPLDRMTGYFHTNGASSKN